MWPFKKKFPTKTDLSQKNEWKMTSGYLEGDTPYVRRVNIAYKSIAAHPELSDQIVVVAQIKTPNENGFHDAQEGKELGVIEDLVVASLTAHNRAFHVGVLTSRARKEWIFYGEHTPELQESFRLLCAMPMTHGLTLSFRSDPEWKDYRSSLT